MATFDYARIQATALTMLQKFGDTAQLGDGVKLRNVLAVRLNDEKQTLLDSEIQVGDVKFILESKANPLRGERFTFGSESLLLVPKPVPLFKSASVVIAWYAWGRKG